MMKMIRFGVMFLLLLVSNGIVEAEMAASGGSYKYYCTGNCDSLAPDAQGLGGLLLAGGGEDVDAAFEWFVQQANGGDVVVLRTSGGDGYNDYLYELVPGAVNSVSTFVLQDAAAASDPLVLSRVSAATAIFWAGGDQWTYYSLAKGTPLQAAIEAAIDAAGSKRAVYGGTSAGMAVQTEFIFTAEFDTVTSREAAADPYDYRNQFGTGFAGSPLLRACISDTHYAQRDRAGRSLSWLARLHRDVYTRAPLVIACNEASALLVRPDGRAFFRAGSASGSAVYLMTLDPTASLQCQPRKSLRVTASVLKMAANSTDFYDFAVGAPVNNPDSISYTITADNGKITSSQIGGSPY